MTNLIISIERFVDSSQPGWVECSLIDSDDQRHFFREKVPIVSNECLTKKSEYPRRGYIRCEVVAFSPGGPNAMYVVDTSAVDGVESVAGVTKFTVGWDQVSDDSEEGKLH